MIREELLNMCDDLDMAIVKSIPIKVVKTYEVKNETYGECPNCSHTGLKESIHEACWWCGQSIIWPKEELIEADKSLSIILGEYPNFHISGSIQGMRDKLYGQSAFLIKCGEYIYKVGEDIYNSIKDKSVGDWMKTDDNQLCIELVNNNYNSLFGMINIAKDNSSYLLGLEIIEIDPEEDLESDISSYYDSVEDIKREYGDKWLQIVAECISENNFINIPKIRFYSLEALNEHLKNNGIEYELYV